MELIARNRPENSLWDEKQRKLLDKAPLYSKTTLQAENQSDGFVNKADSRLVKLTKYALHVEILNFINLH